MDLVAIDVHGKLAAGSAPLVLASDARFSSRHYKGAPAMPFPLLKMASITITSPTNWLASLRSNTGKTRQSCRSSGCRLESGGPKKRTVLDGNVQ
jgi:hypothetical protein